LTTTMTSLAEVIDALKDSGLRDGVGVIVGGAPLTREYAESIGADGFADDCVSAVDEANRLMAAK
jgi:5-methyltetrahydrofolate--homocysteine methyltransferase